MKQNNIILLLAVVGICVCGGIWLYQGKKVQTSETIVSEETNDRLSQQTAENEEGQIYIHIVGAVKKPGGIYISEKAACDRSSRKSRWFYERCRYDGD